jgi:predicted permease
VSPAALAAYLVAAAGGVFTLGLMLFASEPWDADLGRWAVILPFAALAVSPYLVVARLARAFRHDVTKSRVLLAVALLVTVPAVWIYVQGFFVEPDAQSALLFVFVPIYQLFAGAAAGIAVWLLILAARRWRVR